MKKLTIGIMGTRGIPNHYGGFEQFTECLAKGLVERGHEVMVYCSHFHPYQEKKWNGVTLIHCRDAEHILGTAGQFIYDFNCIADARKQNFDVLLHLGYTSDAIFYWYWPKHTIHIVNMDGLEWKRTKYNRITQRFLRKSESLAVKKAGELIADSPGIQTYLQEKHKRPVTHIPYPAAETGTTDTSVLEKYQLLPNQYFLLIARMEPENNIEMILKGYLRSGHQWPFVVVGSVSTSFGKKIQQQFSNSPVIFTGAIYEKPVLDALRHHSALYFHGHSVGGTNPSLLEAMACGCAIAAHDNLFNRFVTGEHALYFSDTETVSRIIQQYRPGLLAKEKQQNLQKIKTMYHPQNIIGQYEALMLKAVLQKEALHGIALTPTHQTGEIHL